MKKHKEVHGKKEEMVVFKMRLRRNSRKKTNTKDAGRKGPKDERRGQQMIKKATFMKMRNMSCNLPISFVL